MPTIGHMVHELTHELLHVDGRLWRTVAALFLQPGRLTAEYWAGRRASWIGPFRIFLIAAAAHLLLVAGIGPMNFQTLVQRTANGDLDVSIGSAAERRAGLGGMTSVGTSEQEAYLERLRRAYASVRYTAVPVFALATLALYRRRQSHVAAHVVLAVHFYAFWYSVSILTSRLPAPAGGWIGVALSAAYLVLALRRVFGEGLVRTLAKAAVLYVAMVALEMGLALASAMWVRPLA